MFAYIVRRLLLIVPTLFGIMIINFLVVQAAPGGPVEQMIARIKGTAVDATARVSGAGQAEIRPRRQPDRRPPSRRSQQQVPRRPRPRPGV